MRTTLVMASFALAGAALGARDVRFYLGYGDSNFAALNGSSVGSEMKSVSAVPAVGSKFTVSLFIQSKSTTDKRYAGGSMFLGFDMGTTNSSVSGYSTLAAAHAAGLSKRVSIEGEFKNWATGLPGIDTNGAPASVNLTSLGGAKYRGEAWGGIPNTVRSIGINESVGFGLGNDLALGAGAVIRLVDMTLTNLGIGLQQYGDGGLENGLTVNSCPTLESSGVNGLYDGLANLSGQQESTVKYRLGPVPEPPVWIAMACGLALLRRRR